MKKIIILGIFISIIACNKESTSENQNRETVNTDKEKINNSLKKMYNGDIDINAQYPLGDTLIFSKGIVALNSQCDSVTDADAERIAKSDSPGDKPLLREGSRVSSLYEGVTDFKIAEIKTVGEKIEVTVTLSNKNYPEQKAWNEKIIFINQNGLKIDNIYFDKDISNPDYLDLREVLIGFIKQIDK